MAVPTPRTGLHARAEQSLVLEPRMLQAIEVLQLPAQDLEAWLLDAAEQNQALQVEPPAAPEGGRLGRGWDATERHDEALRNQPERAPGLVASLAEQASWLELEPALDDALHFLIGCLDGNGYLSPDDEELLDLARLEGLALDAGALGRAIAQLQRLEPRGVGGRDLTEALLLQLDPRAPDYAALCRLVEECLDDLAANRMPAVARALGVELDELARLVAQLRGLDPRPGAGLAEEDAPVLRADVLVLPTEDGGWEVSVDRAALPAVALDAELVELAKDRTQGREARAWARERVERARWIVDAVRQRGETLLRVARRVFEHQAAFLAEGPGHLAPLTMSQLADELELHVSTISRTVAGKHVQTPWGFFALRHFFQSAAPGAAAGAESVTARDDLREVVRRLFAEEDPRAPLSDEDAVAELTRRGHPLARRTVAKYRTELGIPSSYRRRRYA
ncbi:MAG: RNA polymerase factor sigma-54 [Planctomycetes bacterium]|nr:RNA polymerase factor sigma-54 [Planctomycetota bacterium]